MSCPCLPDSRRKRQPRRMWSIGESDAAPSFSIWQPLVFKETDSNILHLCFLFFCLSQWRRNLELYNENVLSHPPFGPPLLSFVSISRCNKVFFLFLTPFWRLSSLTSRLYNSDCLEIGRRDGVISWWKVLDEDKYDKESQEKRKIGNQVVKLNRDIYILKV